jgi:glycosyltransferase involved in cell wall biosynthesis
MPFGVFDVLGGAQRQIQGIAPILERRGVRTSIVTRGSSAGTAAHERRPGLDVYRVPVPRSRAGAALAYTALGTGVVARLRPDLIHAHQLISPTTIGILAGAALGVPVVAKVLSAGPNGDLDKVLRNGFGRKRLEAIKKRVSVFICLSEDVARELLANGVPPEKMRRVPNGVDLDRFRPPSGDERAAVRRRLGIPLDAPVLLYCGRFAPVKRLDVLLQAVRDIPVHLLLVGEGTEARSLGQSARSAGWAGRLHIHPAVEDTAPLYRAADVYVSASSTEGMSGSVLEAMATGLPVAAAPASGMSEVLGTEAGVLADDFSAAALASALRRLDDAEERARLGAAGRRRAAARYGLEATADLLISLYAELCPERAGRL